MRSRARGQRRRKRPRPTWANLCRFSWIVCRSHALCAHPRLPYREVPPVERTHILCARTLLSPEAHQRARRVRHVAARPRRTSPRLQIDSFAAIRGLPLLPTARAGMVFPVTAYCGPRYVPVRAPVHEPPAPWGRAASCGTAPLSRGSAAAETLDALPLAAPAQLACMSAAVGSSLRSPCAQGVVRDRRAPAAAQARRRCAAARRQQRRSGSGDGGGGSSTIEAGGTRGGCASAAVMRYCPRGSVRSSGGGAR